MGFFFYLTNSRNCMTDWIFLLFLFKCLQMKPNSWPSSGKYIDFMTLFLVLTLSLLASNYSSYFHFSLYQFLSLFLTSMMYLCIHVSQWKPILDQYRIFLRMPGWLSWKTMELLISRSWVQDTSWVQRLFKKKNFFFKYSIYIKL